MSNLREALRVPVEELTWSHSFEGLGGETTASVEPHAEIFGQSRAVKAIRLGLNMKSPGYNIFVSGSNGTGRTSTTAKLLEEAGMVGPGPDDLCYANNFKNPDQPRLLRFTAGKGEIFKQQMKDLVDALQKKIPAIFESEEYQSTRNEIVNRHIGQQKALFKNFEAKVTAENFMMVQVQVGPFTRPDLAPVIIGNAMKIEQLEALVEEGKFSADELEKIKKRYKELSQEMEKIFKEARDIDKTIQKNLEDLSQEWVEPVLREMINPLREAYPTDAVGAHLDDVGKDIINHLDRFKPRLVQQPGMEGPQPGQPMLLPPDPAQLKDYEINLLVDNSDTTKPPIIFETTSSFRNLFGTIERVMDSRGMWTSDFRHIKAGSFLRANGGYLVLNARDVLTEVGVWPTLKRTLRHGVMEIQTDPFSFLFTSALQPERIPVNLKVILIGDPHIYDLLHWYEEDFRKIFKIKADFDDTMPNTGDNLDKLVGFISHICRDEDLLPFDRSAVGAVARLSVRWAGRKKKITTQLERIGDLLRESDLEARQNNASTVTAEHVNEANAGRIERVNMYEEKVQEYIEEGILMIDCKGKRVGQINGLSVYSLSEYSFGRPSRITAKVSMGKSGIVNVEREAELSGQSYNKGVLILTGFLRSRFAQDRPLNLTASITFEQSYSGVDGDSASSTEIYALLSALAEVPIDQGIAVTGSVNQHGEIQPIGGVNQKVEGFYKTCNAFGLTGEQGVMIPKLNLGDLTLDPEVVDAVREGKFNIWAIETVDQGIELLTGMPAGEPDEDGNYPEGTLNYLVDQRLEDLSQGMKEFESDHEPEAPADESEDQHQQQPA
ncbi:MAG: AAA family ATPase [Pseudomonadota bacterium]